MILRQALENQRRVAIPAHVEPKRVKALFAAVAVALALTACGGGSGDDDPAYNVLGERRSVQPVDCQSTPTACQQ